MAETEPQPSLLYAEDEAVQRRMVSTLLRNKLGYNVVAVAHGQELLAELMNAPVATYSAVLLDINMPMMNGFETLNRIRELRPDIPVLMLTAEDNATKVMEAIKLGATDYLTKPVDPQRLQVALQNALRLNRLTTEVHGLRREKTHTFSTIAGHNGGLATAVALGRRAAQSDVPVLITGETGTGKEVFARALHTESSRARGPFVAVNCGAIPENLVESILFGHEKGAFTGAVEARRGVFREAENGTVFLDEIGDLPRDAQAKLLRVLQEREITPVGSAQTLPINVRVIAATHRNLPEAVAQGQFREDLYFRLNVLTITLPPLRMRRGDIPVLTHRLLLDFCTTHRMPQKTITPEALAYLDKLPYPGNVRELENLLHRAVVLSDGEELTLAHVLQQPTPEQPTTAPLTLPLLHAQGTWKTLDELENQILHAALQHHAYNAQKAAAALGVAKSTFYRRIKNKEESKL